MAEPNPAPAAAAAPAASVAPVAPTAPIVAFAEQLPADIRGEAAFRDIKDLEGLSKSYLSAQRMLGHRPEDLVVVPGSDDAESWSKLYDRLGRPADPAGYTLAVPEGVQGDEELQTSFRTWAHEAGLTPKQAERIFAGYNEMVAARGAQAQEQAQAASAATIATLKQEWGTAFEQNVTQAKAALAHYGDAELVAYLNESRLGDDPRVLRMFAKLGRGLAEDGLIGQSRPNGGFALSPGEAKQQIAALKSDKVFLEAYMSKTHPGHKAAVERISGLYEAAVPSAA